MLHPPAAYVSPVHQVRRVRVRARRSRRRPDFVALYALAAIAGAASGFILSVIG